MPGDRIPDNGGDELDGPVRAPLARTRKETQGRRHGQGHTSLPTGPILSGFLPRNFFEELAHK